MNVYGHGRCCACGKTDDRVRAYAHEAYPFCSPCADAAARRDELAHTPMALAVARKTGWSIDDYAIQRGWTGVGIGPCGQHRDSGALARSNYEVAGYILADLGPDHADDFDDASFCHWGVGWVEERTYNVGSPVVAAAVEQMVASLEDYPLLDEAHFSELEWTEALDTLTRCYDVPEEHTVDVLSALHDAGIGSCADDWRDDDVQDAIREVCGPVLDDDKELPC